MTRLNECLIVGIFLALGIGMSIGSHLQKLNDRPPQDKKWIRMWDNGKVMLDIDFFNVNLGEHWSTISFPYNKKIIVVDIKQYE